MRLDLHPHLDIDLHLHLYISPLPYLSIGLLHLNFDTHHLGTDLILLSLGLILQNLGLDLLSIGSIMRSILTHHIWSDNILNLHKENEDIVTLILIITSSRVLKLTLLLLMVN